jgi:hypothetical protein
MTNLLAEAINCSNGDRAAKIIQDALGIESNEVANYAFPNTWPDRSRAARPHHWRVAVDRGAVSAHDNATPFFQFALALVIPGALVILLAALLWTGRT